jgi:hypothetical protein
MVHDEKPHGTGGERMETAVEADRREVYTGMLVALETEYSCGCCYRQPFRVTGLRALTNGFGPHVSYTRCMDHTDSEPESGFRYEVTAKTLVFEDPSIGAEDYISLPLY